MGKDLVFVGGGHAHLTALMHLGDYVGKGYRVTLISPVVRHYYSGMGPGMLSGMYAPHEIRFNVKKLAEDRGGKFVLGRVVRVDSGRRALTLEDGSECPYDVVSFNTGSVVPCDLVKGSMEHVFPVKPIVNLLKGRRAILEAIQGGTPRLTVLGGGAAGLELAANIWRLVHQNNGNAEITVITGRTLLPHLPVKVRRLAGDSLARRGIEVIEGARIDRVEDGRVILEDGRTFSFDLVFPAIGVKSYPIFRDSGIPTAQDGSFLVNDYLQSVAHPEIFGGGDCISLQGRKLDRVGVYAVRQNPILYKNLMAALEGRGMEKFVPQEVYMLVFNMGDGTGIFVRKNWVWKGRLAFKLKDYIDRKFMRTFQVSGESEDKTEYSEE
ncbi:MAG: FAD-dependent oxidoreductase [Deltaproteobacteria bacterium]